MNLEDIRNQLRSFAEDYHEMQLSHRAYEVIWGIIQSIDHELESTDKTVSKKFK